MVQLSHPYMTTGKTIALTRQIFVGKVMSLLFNMLFRLVIAFLPRSKHPLISWLQSPSAVILEPRKLSLSLSPLFPHLFAMRPRDNLRWLISGRPGTFWISGSQIPAQCLAVTLTSPILLVITLLLLSPHIISSAFVSPSSMHHCGKNHSFN